jgi:hypothetical protein
MPAHASWLYRKRSDFERARQYPTSGWIFWCDLSPFGTWTGFDTSYRDFKQVTDPGAAYAYAQSRCFVSTLLSDADFRTYWDDPPVTTEDV